MYGWDAPEAVCFYRDSGTKLSFIWQWASFYFWEIICILYIIVILICVGVKLYKVSSQTVSSNISGQTITSRYDKNVLRNKAIISVVVKKVIWYPVVPIITQGPNFLFETDIYVNQKVNVVFSMLATLLTLQGFLNTIAFMQDAAVSRAYKLTKLNWWYNHVNKYEELYPHLSRNKAFDPLDSDHEVKDEQQQQNQKQPSFAEKLRYNLLVSLFSKPTGDELLVEYDHYMTTRDEGGESEFIQSTKEKSDSDTTVNDDDYDLEEFNKNVLCKL
jgi:hypothetical protein